MTGRIHYTPEAEQHFQDLDERITRAASAEITRRFVAAIMDHIDGILVFPLAGRARDDVRPGMRTTTTFKKKTLVAYEVDESSGELVVNILGVFHARTGRPRSATTRAIRRRANDAVVRGKCVAGGPTATGRRPTVSNAFAQVSRTMPTLTVNSR